MIQVLEYGIIQLIPWGENMSGQHVEISKFLSLVLRHKPESIGLTLDTEGWVDIDVLIACANQAGQILTRQLLQEVVETSDKKRFTVSEDGLRIRAAQGHSTESVAIAHVEKQPPEFLYHGTAMRFLDSIREKGLLPGSRHYVHLSEDEQTAIAVGQRYGKPIVLKVKALLMAEQGFKFYQADNGVWLTGNVSIEFIQPSD
ncbi:MAG: RNA 2'-phosphotransferase [Methylobacillus sp.]|jgi:putative RNA 2'-phosphotransferase|nr:RNA 2'-phosphotransferase [Methylobacillus sp.]